MHDIRLAGYEATQCGLSEQEEALLCQTPLRQCLTALGHHPELSVDFAVCLRETERLAGEGLWLEDCKESDTAANFIAFTAAQWLFSRYENTWADLPALMPETMRFVLWRVIAAGGVWHDVVEGAAESYAKESNVPRVRTKVRLIQRAVQRRHVESILQIIDEEGENAVCLDMWAPAVEKLKAGVPEEEDEILIGSTEVFCAPRQRFWPYRPCCVEVVHRLAAGTTREEYLEAARHAWDSGQIKQHLGEHWLFKRGLGRPKEFIEHVDLYANWYDRCCCGGQTTEAFIDAVQDGSVAIEGWKAPPSRSGIKQRLGAAKEWLQPNRALKQVSLASFIRHSRVVNGELQLPDIWNR